MPRYSIPSRSGSHSWGRPNGAGCLPEDGLEERARNTAAADTSDSSCNPPCPRHCESTFHLSEAGGNPIRRPAKPGRHSRQIWQSSLFLFLSNCHLSLCSSPAVYCNFRICQPLGDSARLHLESGGKALLDELLAGGALRVAPVVAQGQGYRDLYLPEGEWRGYKTDRIMEGGHWTRGYAVPLDTLRYLSA